MKNAVGILISKPNCVSVYALSELQAMALYGVEAYLYYVGEVDTYLEKGYINASRWENGELIPCRTDMPLYSEAHSYGFSSNDCPPNCWEWLLRNTRFTNLYRMQKHELCLRMLQNGMDEYVIPTFTINSYTDLLQKFATVPSIILKPSNARKGQMIMVVRLTTDGIKYKSNNGTGVLTEEMFRDYIEQVHQIRGSLLIGQPFINSKNDDGKAIDFRCLVCLNGKGEWENVLNIVRIGKSDITSNLHTGGSIGDCKAVLHSIFHEKADDKLFELEQLARRVAMLVQQYATMPVSMQGVDIGLDRDTNRFYVFETNTQVGNTIITGDWEREKMRAQYFKYLLSRT